MVLLSLTATAAPYQLRDVGRLALPDEPTALIVLTPGLSDRALSPLIAAVESAGVDVWLLRFPPTAQDAGQITAVWLPEAVEAVRSESGVALIGHGLGGTLAALSVDVGATTPDALVLLGSPLTSEPMALMDWLAHRPLPEGDLDLADVVDSQWNGAAVLPLLLGEPLPSLEWLSPDWLATLQSWALGGLSIDLTDSPVPVWAGASGLDNLAPPEWIRPRVPSASFHRFGYLRFESADPTHVDLLSSPPALRMLSRWTAHTLGAP